MKNRFTFSSLLLSLIFLAFQPNNSNASHLVGGDITYSCVGTNSYLFKLNLYRDCNGINLPNQTTIDFTSPTCGTFTVTLNLVAGYPQDVTSTCANFVTSCNGGFQYGVQHFQYSDLVTPSCSANDYVVSWNTCCRNNIINTLQNPQGSGFYISTDFTTTTAVCNTSPQFLNAPVSYFCVNEPVNYSHGAYDFDNDSLVFSLTDCHTASGYSVNYWTPYSGTNPLITATGVTIDSTSGNIQFTPTTTHVGVVCVLVEEYRNGVKIGEVVRDMQFNIITCPNNSLPIASGIGGTADSTGTTGSYEITACMGDTVFFNIQTYDQDVIDSFPSSCQTVSLGWNAGIAQGSFSVDTSGMTPTGTFFWIPTSNDIGTHLFDVFVEDDACPVKGINIYTFKVQVIGRAINLTTPTQHTFCLDTATFPLPNYTPFQNGLWTGPGIIDSVAAIFSPTIAGIGQHTLLFQYTDPFTFCVTIDSMKVIVIPSTTISAGQDDTLCVNSIPLQLVGSPNTGTWTGVSVSPTGLFDPSVGVGVYHMVYSDSFSNCLALDYSVITVLPEPTVSAGVDLTVCENTIITISQQTGVSPPNGTWSGSGITDATTGLFDPSGQSIGTGTFPIYYTASDGICSSTDTILVTVTSVVAIDAGADLNICVTESAQLTGTPFGGIWSGYGIDSSGTFDLTATGNTGNFVVYYTYNNSSCSGMDSLTISISALPVITMSGNDTLYLSSPNKTMFGYSPLGGIWSGVGIIDSINGVFDPSVAGVGLHVLTYTYDDGICSNSVTKLVIVLNDVGTASILMPSVKIFPNPITDVLNIEFEEMLTTNGTIAIRNVLGEVLYENTLPKVSSLQIPFDKNWSSGVYLVSLEINNEIFTFRVVKP